MSYFSKDLLQGKVVFMTGGYRGMLYEMASSFLKHGAKIMIVARKQENLMKAKESLKALFPSSEIEVATCDVREIDSVKKAVSHCLNKFGKIDILVNGAAGNFLAPVRGLSSNAFKTVISIDLIGTFNVSKVVYEEAFIKQNSGVILNISATLQLTASALQAHSASAKSGIDTLTRIMALEFGSRNVRVVGIAPGGIKDTEGFERLLPKEIKERYGDSDDLAKALIPLNRWGLNQDVANFALYLVSDAASYITGQTMVLDGGQMFTIGNPLFLYDPKQLNELRAKL